MTTPHDHPEIPEPPRPSDAAPAGAGGTAASPPPSPPPPRSVRPGAVAVAVALVAVALFVGTRIGGRGAAAGDDPAAEASAGGAAHYYTCGMHPWVVLPHPGPCPICGMPLVPLDPAKFSGEVTIDPVVVQNIGVRTAAVTQGPLVQTIRTVGTIDYDEQKVRDVNVKISGWVQKIYVDTLGQPVKRGDPLFELYSPDLYAAQQEYLLALRGGDLGGGGKALVDAARTKLEYYDVPASEIAALARRGKAAKTLTLRSPYDGIVFEKKAFEGMRIDPGMQAYRIADLSKVWVMATVYEYQLPYVHVGQRAVVTLPYLPDQRLEGKVVYVYPYLDTRARQAQVRIELDNPGVALKPGMYATVALKGTRGERRTLAPREAVIDTGERKVAFVAKGEGHFEPRDVQTGLETDDGMIEIVKGLSPGEQVVTSGQFLLDSEAKVREALAKMIKGTPAVPEKPAAAAPAPDLAQVPERARPALSKVLDGYLAVQRALAADDLAPVAARARELAAAVDQLAAVPVSGQPGFWEAHQASAVRDGARALAQARTLDAAREAFAPLSRAAVALVSATGVPAGLGELDALHCPMYAQADGGATWLQPAGAVRNPYLGSAMLTCSDDRKPLPAAGGSEAIR